MPTGIFKRTEKHRSNISKALMGYKHTQEFKDKMSKRMKGNKISQETRKKISESLTGIKRKPLTEEHKRKISEFQKGRTVSLATKQKIKESILKNKGFGKWMIGKKLSEETKRKQSEALKFVPKSEEHKKNMSKSKTLELRKQVSERMKGSNAPNWKGGITSIHEKLRHCLEYKFWREAVFKRDNWTCIECENKRGGNLEPHHIISFSSILAKIRFQYGVENFYENALKDKLLWDINNGKTLCIDCHKKTNNYGYRGNLKLSPYIKELMQ